MVRWNAPRITGGFNYVMHVKGVSVCVVAEFVLLCAQYGVKMIAKDEEVEGVEQA
jgi:hypothetical protein